MRPDTDWQRLAMCHNECCVVWLRLSTATLQRILAYRSKPSLRQTPHAALFDSCVQLKSVLYIAVFPPKLQYSHLWPISKPPTVHPTHASAALQSCLYWKGLGMADTTCSVRCTRAGNCVVACHVISDVRSRE